MRHNGAVVGSQQEPTGERSSALTSGTTPSSVHQATGGVQRVTSPQKAASSMNTAEAKSGSQVTRTMTVSRVHTKDQSQSRRKLSRWSRAFPGSASWGVHRSSMCHLEEPIALVPHFKMETVEVIQLSPQERISERMVERISERTQTVDAAVPQKLEEPVVDQPGDQACRDSVDEVHRQGCRCGCGDATTGQTAQKPVEVPINEVTKHARIHTSAKTVEVPPAQFAGTVVDVPVTMQITPLMTTGPPVSDCAEDRESPAGAARERVHEQIVDVPVPHVAL